MTKTCIVSADIVHAVTKKGDAGFVTACGHVIPKAEYARVSYGSGFPTSPQGYPCKECFA